MINFKNAEFVISATGIKNAPRKSFPEILLVGKSNVGKSSFINALTTHKNLAFTSSKPGHTQLLNFYDIDHKFYLVDAPGYGYSQKGIDLDRLFGEMMEDYFSNSSHLKHVFVLHDSRRDFNDEDLEIVDYLISKNIPFSVINTKFDKLNQKEKAKLNSELAKINLEKSNIFNTSILDLNSYNSLKSFINSIV